MKRHIFIVSHVTDTLNLFHLSKMYDLFGLFIGKGSFPSLEHMCGIGNLRTCEESYTCVVPSKVKALTAICDRCSYSIPVTAALLNFFINKTLNYSLYKYIEIWYAGRMPTCSLTVPEKYDVESSVYFVLAQSRRRFYIERPITIRGGNSFLQQN